MQRQPPGRPTVVPSRLAVHFDAQEPSSLKKVQPVLERHPECVQSVLHVARRVVVLRGGLAGGRPFWSLSDAPMAPLVAPTVQSYPSRD